MNKSLVAMAALMAMAGAVQAQSSVTLYGIVDAAVRWSDNEGVGKDDITRMVGGGMSQSRWGFRIDEDLGGGLRALANLENRFTADDGAQQNGVQWSQGWVGIQSSSFGRVLLGRQYNILFDLMSTTYAPFKFSPYIETFKPELTIQGAGGAAGLGSRNANMVKYIVALGSFTGEAQVSASEGDAATLKSYGLGGKYVIGPLAFGGGGIESETASGLKGSAYQAGVAFTSGPIYLNYSYGKNDFDVGIGAAAIAAATLGTSLTVPVSTNPLAAARLSERELHTFGGTYNITPALLVGFQYYIGKQKVDNSTAPTIGTSAGKIDAYAILADYAFSKRTDVYIEHDYVKLKDGAVLNGTFASPATAAATGATKRNSVMVGVRHRF
jgi:predicted porin